MLVEQYVYLGLRSDALTPDEITAAVGLVPDRVEGRGSKHPEHDIPRAHLWAVECRGADSGVDELIDRLLVRVTEAAEAVRRLVDAESVSAVIQVVREFSPQAPEGRGGPGPSDQEGADAPPSSGVLGWHLDRRVVAFLHASGAELDVDEYDCS